MTARRKLVIVSASLACLIGGYTVVAVVGFSLLDLFFTPLVRSQGRWADGVGYVSRLEAEGFIQFGALLAGVVLTVVGFKTTSKDATTVGRKLLVISVSFAGLIGGYFLVPVVAISLTPVFFPVTYFGYSPLFKGLIIFGAPVACVVLAVVGFKTTSKDATTVGRKLLVISVSFAGLIGGYFLVPVVAISLTPVFFPVPGWLLGLIQLAALVAGVVLAVVGFKTTSKDAGVQPAE